MNREQWLINATEQLKDRLFNNTDYTVPEVRVSVGFPKGRGGRNGAKAIGQCWSGACSEDGRPQIFIHPEITDSNRVMDILAHEQVHASVGTEAGHGAPFKRLAVAIGLEGQMTATVASSRLNTVLTEIVGVIGEYPHSKLNAEQGAKKQTTRMIKTECSECGYIAYLSRKWIAEAGTPICPSDEIALEVGGE